MPDNGAPKAFHSCPKYPVLLRYQGLHWPDCQVALQEIPSPFSGPEAAHALGHGHVPGNGARPRTLDAGHLVSHGMSKRGVQGTQLMRSAAESDSALLLGGDLGVVVVQARSRAHTPGVPVQPEWSC